MQKLFRYGEKGFTLIELLVVISILGVLAAVVVLNVTKYMGAGQNEAAGTELVQIQTAVAAYMYDHTGTAPTKFDDISPYVLSTPNWTYQFGPDGKVTQVPNP